MTRTACLSAFCRFIGKKEMEIVTICFQLYFRY